MRWNPDKPGTHQYASDVGWPQKQANTIKTIMDEFPEAQLVFDIPQYSE